MGRTEIGNWELPITFGAVQTALDRCGAPVDASEAHGVLCGMLCGRPGTTVSQWLEPIWDTDGRAINVPEAARQVLQALWEETRQRLREQDYNFSPLLPEDEEPLTPRVEALADFASGFLYGLGLTGRQPGGEALEFLDDLSEITRLEPDSEAGDVQETAYMELVEYLRVGVQLVREDLIGDPSGTPLLH